jgi:ABC-type branched-subunit amino acid transport system permease subunit
MNSSAKDATSVQRAVPDGPACGGPRAAAGLVAGGALAADLLGHLFNNIGLAAMATLGLVLLTGVAGMTSFGQAAFVGLGAYTCAWLTVGTDVPAWLAALAGSPWLALPPGCWSPSGWRPAWAR